MPTSERETSTVQRVRWRLVLGIVLLAVLVFAFLYLMSLIIGSGLPYHN
jgi:hypothetical protein